MTEIIKVVLTGGPCGGKSSALPYIKQELEKLGLTVLTIDERATILINSGEKPENMGVVQFQKELFKQAYEEEKAVISKASSLNVDKVVILFDRGLLDGRAFVSEAEFSSFISEYGLNEEQIRNSYDAVFHLVTAAEGAEDYYNCINNTARTETSEEARTNDKRILSAWTGNNHLRIIDNSTDFTGKMNRLKDEILAFLGIPEPVEIERKFLIEYPDIEFLNSLELCRKIPITQAYLFTPQEGNFRVRKRGDVNNAIYIKTIKRKISEIKRIEIETNISEKEYLSYLSKKENILGVISKDRYCIAYNNTYYELDVYLFWQDKALLEIELLSENQKYQLPPFIKLIREVTTEPEFRNFTLAQKYSE